MRQGGAREAFWRAERAALKAGKTRAEAAVAGKAAYRLHQEETARIGAEKLARREKSAKTCQICGRQIMAENGSIAHHGYTRPGCGYQTSSCFGARKWPYEVSRDDLEIYINALKDMYGRDAKYFRNVLNERISLPETIRRKDKLNLKADRHGYVAIPISLTRANFEAVRKEYLHDFIMNGWHEFDERKRVHVAKHKRGLSYLKRDIREQQKRFALWRQTLAWVNNSWQPVPVWP